MCSKSMNKGGREAIAKKYAKTCQTGVERKRGADVGDPIFKIIDRILFGKPRTLGESR